MCNIKPIRTEAEFQAAQERLYEMRHAVPGTPEGDEFEVLADLVEFYDEIHYVRADPGKDPTAGAMIEFWLDQRGWTVAKVNALSDAPQDIGAVIAGKAALTMRMALLLHEQVGVPEEYLLVNTMTQPAPAEPTIS